MEETNSHIRIVFWYIEGEVENLLYRFISVRSEFEMEYQIVGNESIVFCHSLFHGWTIVDQVDRSLSRIYIIFFH